MRAAPVASITRRSKPSAAPAGRRHLRERGNEVRIDRVAFSITALLFVHLRFEAPALFGWIGELAKGIGELHAAGIKLEPLREARILAVGSRQSGEVGRVLIEHGGATIAKLGFHFREQDAAEGIGPSIVLGNAHTTGERGCGKRGRIRQRCAKRCRQIDAGVAAEGLRQADALGRGEGISAALAVAQEARACCLGRKAQQRGAVLHELFVGCVRPIPLEHRERRMV